jgi:hypothetical protein
MALKNTNLTNTATAIYTSAGQSVVTVIYFCNTGSFATDFTVYLVPNGQSVTDDRAIYYAAQLTERDTYVTDTEKIVLDNGDAIFAKINNPTNNVGMKVVATVSYMGV